MKEEIFGFPLFFSIDFIQVKFVKKYTIIPDADFLSKVLNYLDEQYLAFAYFSNSGSDYPHGEFETVIYAGQKEVTLDQVENYIQKSTLVGLIAYDYKNSIEQLKSENYELVSSEADHVFFIPEITIKIFSESIEIESELPIDFVSFINNFRNETPNPLVAIQPLTSKEEYINHVINIKKRIEDGDVYELNYCQAFTFHHFQWNPIVGFMKLRTLSSMPFSTFYKYQNKYLLCASPERYIKREGEMLISQPIKGTIKRGRNLEEDLFLKNQLKNSAKERAENLMIVDLMRNDLSKVAVTGSIKVEELFGIYPFPRVFQMISTVSGNIKKDITFKDIIHSTFPMGSMTGAPKIKSMELIEQYEDFKRGWFSGSVGYIKSNGDFDFNVIIRSLIYDKSTGNGYFAVGSAITYDADPDYEYQECMLKASALVNLLSKK
jgi:para-aminobenzoate synthetase component I